MTTAIALRLLIVGERDPRPLIGALERGGLRAETRNVADVSQMHAALQAGRWDIVVANCAPGGPDALALVRALAAEAGALPIVLVTDPIGEEATVEAVKAGACDIVLRSNLGRLPCVVERELDAARGRSAASKETQTMRGRDRSIQMLVDSMDALLFELDRDQRMVSMSGGWLNKAGRSASEYIGKTVRELTGSSEAARPHEEANRRVLAGEHVVYEWSGKAADGKGYHIQTALSPLCDEAGRVVGIVGVMMDITPRKKAEERLRHSEQLYRDLVEVSEAGVARFDVEGRRTFVNETMVKRYGVSAEELLKGTVADRELPEDRARNVRLFRQCVETGRPAPDIISRFMRDGQLCYTKSNLTPLFDREGKVTGVQITSVDVTDLIRAQEGHKRSEELYRGLLSAIGASVIRVDRTGRRTFISNPSMGPNSQDAGHTGNGRFGDKIISPDERKQARELLRRTFQTGEPVRGFVSRQRGPEGPIYVSANWEPIRDSDGNVSEVQITSFDITELVEARERFRASQEMYRGLVESVGAIVKRIDRDGRRTFVSESAAAALGMTVEQMRRGRFGDTIISPEERRQAQALMLETFETGRPVRGFVSRQRYREGPRDVLSNWEPVRDAQGNVVEVQVTAFDITDLVQAQDRVRESERFYHDLADSLDVGVVRVDRQGRRTFANRRALEIAGMSQEAFLGGKFGDTLKPETRAQAWATLLKVLETGGPVERLTGTLMVKDTERWISAAIEPVKDASGQVVEAQITFQDITEQRELQERYYQAQKMETVGRLAGGVAHDFNNLLTVILGNTQLALRSLPPSGQVHDYLEEVLVASKRSANLIRRLLAFARRQASNPQVVDIKGLIAGTETMLRRVIGEDIEMRTTMQDGLWRVKVDPALLEQVMVNLAVNAREAMLHGGKLTIEARNVTVNDGALPPGEYVEVHVRDTGSGMSEDVKAHLFEPFFTTKPHGTGLGLATCYGVVKQAGGDMRVESEMGHGSDFTILLPRTREPLEARARTDDANVPVARGTETLLLVEDEVLVRMLAARALRAQGYTVLEAGDGVEALVVMREHPNVKLDILVTDVVMPQMDGKALAAEMRKGAPGLKVLFITGYAPDSILKSGLTGPDTEVLRKPFPPEALAKRVRQMLDAAPAAYPSRTANGDGAAPGAASLSGSHER